MASDCGGCGRCGWLEKQSPDFNVRASTPGPVMVLNPLTKELHFVSSDLFNV